MYSAATSLDRPADVRREVGNTTNSLSLFKSKLTHQRLCDREVLTGLPLNAPSRSALAVL